MIQEITSDNTCHTHLTKGDAAEFETCVALSPSWLAWDPSDVTLGVKSRGLSEICEALAATMTTFIATVLSDFYFDNDVKL